MTPLPELHRFALLHTRAQGIPAAVTRHVMARIESADGSGPGSWAYEWSRSAEEAEDGGHDLRACRRYSIARFPHPGGDPARTAAQDACVRAFDRWRARTGGIDRLETRFADGSFACWTAGLSARRRPPLLVVLGGIVSVKEQWAPILPRARRMGLAVVVTELPGVGENTVTYDADSPRMLSHLLDEVSGVADVSRTCVAGLSFGGHLVLRRAAEDRRIAGLATVGAPVAHFFRDAVGSPDLPGITARTLAHLTGVPLDGLPATVGGWGPHDDELRALRMPVAYVASRRDEIIPYADIRLLRRTVRDLRLLENDDVHGSPRHVAETRLWLLSQVLGMAGTGGGTRRAAAVASRALRLRRAVRRSRPRPLAPLTGGAR